MYTHLSMEILYLGICMQECIYTCTHTHSHRYIYMLAYCLPNIHLSFSELCVYNICMLKGMYRLCKNMCVHVCVCTYVQCKSHTHTDLKQISYKAINPFQFAWKFSVFSTSISLSWDTPLSQAKEDDYPPTSYFFLCKKIYFSSLIAPN